MYFLQVIFYWVLINLTCVFFFNFFLIKKKKNLDLFLLLISLLLLNFMLVFRHESFRFFLWTNNWNNNFILLYKYNKDGYI